MKLTSCDKQAISDLNDLYLLNIGAYYYQQKDYQRAIEYYRLSASMGNDQAICNLGYCYMYARSVEKDMDLAIAYFKIAAKHKNIDALYKLGTLYLYGIQVKEDQGIGMYYLNEARNQICYYEQAIKYPSLHLTMAKQLLLNQDSTKLEMIYEYLMIAKVGFEEELQQENTYYDQSYHEVLSLLDDPCFDQMNEE